jgi:outer membrane immunogenic protein
VHQVIENIDGLNARCAKTSHREFIMRSRVLTIAVAGLLGTSSAGHAGEWTGISIGIGGGVGAAVHDLSFENGPLLPSPPFPAFGAELSGLGGDGGFFSLGVGVDYQLNSRFVVGGFFDYDWTDYDTALDASLDLGGLVQGRAGADINVENMWSLGGRLGYLLSPSTLLFLSAGYAHADVSDLTASISGAGSLTVARVGDFDGYFIGGGAEVKITKAISIKGEYRYTDLSSETITLLPGIAPEVNDFVTAKLDPDIQTARVSLNYKFGLGGPSDPEPVEDAPVVGSWTQYYLSIGGGYAFTNNELSLSPGPALAGSPIDFDLDFDGFGGQGGALTIGGGYDRQLNSNIVAGLFIDYTMHDAETDLDVNVDSLLSANLGFGINNELSIGGRLGYLVTPATLIYGSAGYSRLELDDARLGGNIFGNSFTLRVASSDAINAFFVGGGVETKINDSISLKLDYRYTNGDSEKITLLPDVFPQANDIVRAEVDPDIQTVRLSLDYRFNFSESEAAPLK